MIGSVSIKWRHVRWVALLGVLPALWACNNRRLQAPEAPPEQETDHYFEQNINNDIDIVFLVDNSSSMEAKQKHVTAQFPTFMNVLKALPQGLPNVHIGIVSSSLGAGAFSDVPGCPPGGDRGVFNKLPLGNMGTCTAVPKDQYIISLDKGTRNNFTGDITDVFTCIAELGASGCGFEHQLAGAARALGGNVGGYKAGSPPENAGFLRDEAFLAVIWLTDEDDCSAPVDSDLFDTKQTGVSDPLGPLASYRCNEFGHLCGGVRPPRSPAMNLMDCHSAEGAGKLIPVADFVNFFKNVKKIPNRIIVSAIASPPSPYSVSVSGSGEPKVNPSCTASFGTGDPGVRMTEFIDAFGTAGSYNSICAESYAPAMDRIAKEIGKKLGAQCIEGILVDKDPNTAGVQADCQVVDQTLTAMGTVQTPLGSCDAGASPPCWRLVPNTKDCTISGYELKVDRGANPAPSNTVSAVKCQTCVDAGDMRCMASGM